MENLTGNSLWWSEGTWLNTKIVCEAVEQDQVFKNSWDDEFYPRSSNMTSILICVLAIILGVTSITWFLLKPLRLPFTSQMIGGVLIVGILFSNKDFRYPALITPSVIYILKMIANIGLIFQLFTAGLETNMSIIIKKLDMKSVFICIAGSFASVAFSAIAYVLTGDVKNKKYKSSQGISSLITLNAETFLMVTYNNLNDLGISNSDIGRLASCISLVIDIMMTATNLIFFILLPHFISSSSKDEVRRSFAIIGYYAVIFLVCRPLVLYIISRIPEGKGLKRTQIMYIFLIVLVVAGVGESLDEIFAVFLFALSLPEHPLSSIFFEKIDAFVSTVFFPVYCATQGLHINIYSLTKRSFHIEFVLIMGYVGKFLGTTLSSRWYNVPFSNSLALSLILCSKGLLDIISLGIWRDKNVLNIEEYTIAVFHFLIVTGALMPLVRRLYEPLSEYSYIFKPSVADATKSGTFQTLTCIYKEDNLPGIARLIEAFHPTTVKPVPLIALQLIPLTGRCTLPLMAPFEQVKALPIFRTKLAYSTRIFEALLRQARGFKSHTCLQHYVAMSSYETMHNDICSLSFEKDVSLIILPLQVGVQWTNIGNFVEDSSMSEREVNKRVLEKSPCSVGMLLDRGNPHDGIDNISIYHVAIIFIGGADDQEALAFARLFGSHPKIRIVVIWLKSELENEKDDVHYETIMNFLSTNIRSDIKIKLKKVVVDDGVDTTKVLLAMNGVVDLVVVGRQHDPSCAPLRGLSLDGLCEHPELGILGDFLATSDLGFSVLVVQQEPQNGDEKLMLNNGSFAVS